MLEEGLINHPVVGFGELGRKAIELRNLLQKIEESEVTSIKIIESTIAFYLYTYVIVYIVFCIHSHKIQQIFLKNLHAGCSAGSFSEL